MASSYQIIQQSMNEKSDNLQELFQHVGITATAQEIDRVLYENRNDVSLSPLQQQLVLRAGQTYDQMLAKSLDGSLDTRTEQASLANSLRKLANQPEYASVRNELEQVAREFEEQIERLSNGQQIDFRAKYTEAAMQARKLEEQAQAEQLRQQQMQEREQQQVQTRQQQQQSQELHQQDLDRHNILNPNKHNDSHLARNSIAALSAFFAATSIAKRDENIGMVPGDKADNFLKRSMDRLIEKHHSLTEMLQQTMTRIETHPTVIHAINTINANTRSDIPVQVSACNAANESIHNLLQDGGTFAGLARQHMANIKELADLQDIMSKAEGKCIDMLAQSSSLRKDGAILADLSQKFTGVNALENKDRPIKIDYTLVANIQAIIGEPDSEERQHQRQRRHSNMS